MKAAVCDRYGPPEVLRLAEVEAPVPAADEILVRVHASTVNSSDWYVRSGIRTSPLRIQVPFRLLVGLRRPRQRILGLILCGEVVDTGAAVRKFRPGDRVWAFTKFRFGAYAEYACVAEGSSVAVAPANVTEEEAAAIATGGCSPCITCDAAASAAATACWCTAPPGRSGPRPSSSRGTPVPS